MVSKILVHRWVSKYREIQIHKLMSCCWRRPRWWRISSVWSRRGWPFHTNVHIQNGMIWSLFLQIIGSQNFAKFTGEDCTSMIEHISRYLTQLGEASVEDAHRVRFFSLSLSGPAFTWFSSLPVSSIANWADLEKKFHTYFYTRTGEKKIIDLTTIR